MNHNDNAFPMQGTFYEEDGQLRQAGLNVRDYIAIKAMQGILSNPSMHPAVDGSYAAEIAYRIADSMLEQSQQDD